MKLNALKIVNALFTVLTALLMSMVATQAQTTSMTVVNPGFESGDLTGWSSVASGGYGSGAKVVNNVADQSSTYPNFHNPLPGTAAGSYYAAVTGYTGNTAEVMYQDLSANGQGNLTLQPNTTYTLTMAIGEGIYSSPNNGFIELINGTNASGTVLASASISTLGYGYYANNFKDLTVTFTTGSVVSGDLTIAIGTIYGYPSSSFIAVDNVRVTSAPAAPTSLAVANSGFETGDLTGWSSVASGGYGSGAKAVNNVADQSNTYPNFHNPLPGTGSGTYYAAVTGYNGNSAEVLYQDVSANGLGNGSLQPNTTYTLTVAIGEGYYSSPNNGFIELINGTTPSGTVLASANVSTLGYGYYADNFKDLTVTFTTGSVVSGDLTIAIGTIYGYPSASFVAVDNVRLTASGGTAPAETVGAGAIKTPAIGPQPSYNIGGGRFVLVKNWHFGSNGTIKTMTDMNTNFQYHDQFGTYNNGNGNYGSNIVSSDSADALYGQPVEGTNTGGAPVRTFFSDYLRTYLVPLNGATTVTPTSHNAGSGSFQAKWTLPNGGALLGQDVIWETRVRYVTPPYFWFSIWNSGNLWNAGAEMDLIESFGYDNGGGATNYVGRYWHSNAVSGSDQVNYSNWGNGMSAAGITSFDATQYHIWTLAYYRDNTYAFYVDGIRVQYGSQPYIWTEGATSTGTPINMSFIFDGAWGHTQVQSVNHSLPASSLVGTYYEWNYSRVYLRQ